MGSIILSDLVIEMHGVEGDLFWDKQDRWEP